MYRDQNEVSHHDIKALATNRTFEVDEWYLLKIINGFEQIGTRSRQTERYNEFIEDRRLEFRDAVFEFRARPDAGVDEQDRMARTLAVAVGVLIAEGTFDECNAKHSIEMLKNFPHFYRTLSELWAYQSEAKENRTISGVQETD